MPANPSEFLLDEEQPFHHVSPSSAPILDDVQELSENEENDEQNCKLDITSEPIKIKSARARDTLDDDDLREVKKSFAQFTQGASCKFSLFFKGGSYPGSYKQSHSYQNRRSKSAERKSPRPRSLDDESSNGNDENNQGKRGI